ncbi:MAG TPA: nitroreductase [Chloroflexota bacterium]|nr:nitroreductase [Chloroflexota bacterium]
MAAVDAAITSRRSVRAFLDTPVPRETIEEILRVASRAPSGTNTQPWRVHVLTGAAKAMLSARIRAVYDDPEQRAQHSEEYAYYPTQWVSPYIDRRRKIGWDLYGLLGIGKTDKRRMHEQHGRNYEFFGAPVGLFFTLDRHLDGQAAWLDLGMYLHGVMLAALGHGLATCPQQAFARYHKIIRAHLDIPEDEIVVCGMSLGRPDPDEPVNRLTTAREPVSEFARFVGL